MTMDAGTLDLGKPHLMTSFTDKWPCRSWTFRSLAALLGEQKFSCRTAPKSCGRMMETQCSHNDVTVGQFCAWLDGTADVSNPLHNFTRADNSCYIDYKYMKDMFEDHVEVFDEVQWRDFGLIGFDGYDSTIWLSSEGANTAGHQDTYGFNLVSQICGKKLWILFPPEDTQYLYPTRVPYEESSIFTGVNIRRPDLQSHPKCGLSQPVVVTLCAGQTLYVPRHWWHYVESLEPSISVNVWVPLKDDRESHLSEAITRCLATSLITSLDTSEGNLQMSAWVNPTESLASNNTNLLLLKTALCQLLEDSSIGVNSNINHKEPHKNAPIQNSELRAHQETAKQDLELNSLPGLNSSDSRTNGEFSSESADVDTGLHDSNQTVNHCAGQVKKTPPLSLLNLFEQIMKGHKVINVDTPFQFEKLTIETRADSPPVPSLKKRKLEPASVSKLLEAGSDLGIEDNLTAETSHFQIFSLNPCLFGSYLQFIDILCRQVGCRQCYGGSSVGRSVELGRDSRGSSVGRSVEPGKDSRGSSVDRSVELGGDNRGAESWKVDVTASRLGQEERSKLEHESFIPATERGCSTRTHTDTGHQFRQRKNVLGSHAQGDSNDKGTLQLEDSNVKTSNGPDNCSEMEDGKNLFCKKEKVSSKMGENLNLFSDRNSDNCHSSLSHIGPSSLLSQQEVGETLLACVLHPDVVKVISGLVKEQCEGRVRQGLGLH